MGIFDFFKSQFKDVIRWENPSPNLIIKKWEHSLDELKNDSSLIVEPGIGAIFVNNGKIEAIETNPGKWSLKTGNTPFITSFQNILSGLESHNKSSVYFIKLQNQTNQKWGTPNEITYIDPVYDFPVELTAFGNFTFKVSDAEKFWTELFSLRDEVSVDEVRMIIVDRFLAHISTLFATEKYSYDVVDTKTLEVGQKLLENTKKEFENLGLELLDFRIEDISFTSKTQGFIDKITESKSRVGAVNANVGISSEGMTNYSNLEKLDAMKTAAGNEGTASAIFGMGVGANLGNEVNSQTKIETSVEEKLSKLKNLREKDLITEEEFNQKRKEILDNL